MVQAIVNRNAGGKRRPISGERENIYIDRGRDEWKRVCYVIPRDNAKLDESTRCNVWAGYVLRVLVRFSVCRS